MYRFTAEGLAREAVEMNRRLCEKTGEPHHVRDDALLLGAVSRPLSRFEGALLYKSITMRAAVLTAGIGQSHPFIQGNKRTAWMMGLYYLEGYGLTLETVEAATAERAVLDLVTREISERTYSTWLAEHLLFL